MNTSHMMPMNVEAEEAILGGILIDPDAISRIADLLQPEYFAIPSHQRIFSAAMTLLTQGYSSDLMTVTTWLTDHGQLEGVGGLSKLAQLVDRTVSAVNIDQYAVLIEEKYRRRKLIEAGFKIAESGNQTARDLEELIAEAETDILSINNRAHSQEISSVGDCLAEVWVSLETGTPPGYLTGLHDVDELIGGLTRKDLIVVAARASMGKTWFAIYLALQIAQKYKLPVLFFSAEMSREALTKRLLALVSGISSQRLMWNKIYDEEWPKLSEAAGNLAQLPIIIDDTPGTSLTPASMRSVLRRVEREHGSPGLVILDYLQLLGERNAGNRAQDIGAIAGHCKAIAKDFDVPFLALAQINRGVEARNDKRPLMSDLKDSGDIEQDADLALCLYRDDYYNADSPERDKIELIVRKQRNGSLGTAKCWFNPEKGTFRNISK
ncbi:replicative DNA helicase [Microcoleus sp. C2C3]|uniref:replicative DNA helicase n=1 Tax=unclassified Microcoleus TaxID=2642155 RepID=UPI002FD46C7D